ncbi:YARHG domain-containing protein [Cellulosilyticum ruminicola]|uniref:YARHG domain-containing protein n=1 Tax=Cellulosilyticum ruminicola TaxID=425254 RepID=UPI0006D060B1|nr:YARHG domain-containing protein [Cellulosilyticum ruminicola]
MKKHFKGIWLFKSLLLGTVVIGGSITYGAGNYQQGQVITAAAAKKEAKAQKSEDNALEQEEWRSLRNEYAEDETSYVYPDSSELALDTYDLSRDYVMTMIGKYEIYTRHGASITDQSYKQYFEDKVWYSGTKKMSDIKLNATEKYNVAFLTWWAKVLKEGSNQQVQSADNRGFCKTTVYMPDRPFKVDLDGDGKSEEIVYSQQYDNDNNFGTMTLKINGKKVIQEEGNFADQIWLVDMNTKDAYKELVIYDQGPSADPVDYFYTYKKGKTIFMGAVEGHLNDVWARNYISNGVLHALKRNDDAGTDRYNCDYTLDKWHKLQEKKTNYFTMHKSAFLKEAIETYTKQNICSKSKTYAAGIGVTILAVDGEGWYKLQFPSGEVRWAYGIQESLAGLWYYD